MFSWTYNVSISSAITNSPNKSYNFNKFYLFGQAHHDLTYISTFRPAYILVTDENLSILESMYACICKGGIVLDKRRSYEGVKTKVSVTLIQVLIWQCMPCHDYKAERGQKRRRNLVHSWQIATEIAGGNPAIGWQDLSRNVWALVFCNDLLHHHRNLVTAHVLGPLWSGRRWDSGGYSIVLGV